MGSGPVSSSVKQLCTVEVNEDVMMILYLHQMILIDNV